MVKELIIEGRILFKKINDNPNRGCKRFLRTNLPVSASVRVFKLALLWRDLESQLIINSGERINVNLTEKAIDLETLRDIKKEFSHNQQKPSGLFAWAEWYFASPYVDTRC